jgi:hypothetical protein
VRLIFLILLCSSSVNAAHSFPLKIMFSLGIILHLFLLLHFLNILHLSNTDLQLYLGVLFIRWLILIVGFTGLCLRFLFLY